MSLRTGQRHIIAIPDHRASRIRLNGGIGKCTCCRSGSATCIIDVHHIAGAVNRRIGNRHFALVGGDLDGLGIRLRGVTPRTGVGFDGHGFLAGYLRIGPRDLDVAVLAWFDFHVGDGRRFVQRRFGGERTRAVRAHGVELERAGLGGQVLDIQGVVVAAAEEGIVQVEQVVLDGGVVGEIPLDGQLVGVRIGAFHLEVRRGGGRVGRAVRNGELADVHLVVVNRLRP